MSEPVDRNLPEVSEALIANGQDKLGEVPGNAGDDYGEESDDYDEEFNDEEQEQYASGEEEGEEGEAEPDNKAPKQQNGLTALLLGDPNVGEEDEDEEDEDEDDDDDDDDEYIEEAPEPTTVNNKKRTRDEILGEVDQDPREESETKKVKA